MFEEAYVLADPDYYERVEAIADRGREFAPGMVPDGWRHEDRELWRVWSRADQTLVERDWTVEVSARADRMAPVLDVFADECFSRGIPFRHVAAERFLMLLQHEHAPREQSGRLLTAYPAEQSAAAGLMAALHGRLAREEGPYILKTLRYGDSKVVHYRRGTFAAPSTSAADGSAAGTDSRRREFAFEHAVRQDGGGGTYVGRQIETGRRVLIREARDHAGLSWDGRTAVERLRDEWRTRRSLHRALPGFCPEPIAYFRDWEHEFLVTEFISGLTLNSWVVRRSPLTHFGEYLHTFDSYLTDCESIVLSLEEQLSALHAAGYALGDVGARNVVLDARGRPRIVGFEPTRSDDHGISALVRLMLGPTLEAAVRHPRSLAHLKADLEEHAVIPPTLWRRAARPHDREGADGGERLPDPEAVAADPERHVRALRDKVAHALTAMGDAANPHRIYPSIPDGYATNTTCVAFGTAGVLHALRQCGIPVPAAIVTRFRADALAEAATLPPGLNIGLAGIAWVLAEYEYLNEARDLLARASDHPGTCGSASLAAGAAGVALAHLSLYERTGDDEHVDAAVRLMDAVPTRDEALLPLLGAHDPSGWLHGRCGIAWTLLPLGAVTGDGGYLDRGRQLLHAELDRATHPGNPAFQFLVSAKDRRAMPYLYCGTAGMLRTIARYNRVAGDERLSDAESRLVPSLRTPYTVMPGLYQGISGLGFTLAELGADGQDAHRARAAAIRTARALFKYAVPGPTGVRFHGEQAKRFSADLYSGGAGILLFLDEVLSPRRDRLFSLDALAARAESICPRSTRSARSG